MINCWIFLTDLTQNVYVNISHACCTAGKWILDAKLKIIWLWQWNHWTWYLIMIMNSTLINILPNSVGKWVLLHEMYKCEIYGCSVIASGNIYITEQILITVFFVIVWHCFVVLNYIPTNNISNNYIVVIPK